MAAVRCKQSKMRFFWGALFGKTWREEDLFHPEALVQGRANHMLQQYKSSSQVGATPSCVNILHVMCACNLAFCFFWTPSFPHQYISLVSTINPFCSDIIPLSSFSISIWRYVAI